jgi:hypothetical protein
MKPTPENRQELLEDVFTPERPSRPVSAEEVLGLIRAARERRQQRRRALACTALLLAAVGWSAALLRGGKSAPGSPAVASANSVPAVAVLPPPPSASLIEHVGDDEMLDLLKGRPVALVHWPDGRQSLLMLTAGENGNGRK